MHPARLDLPDLLADCQTRRQRRSGPGGQHRNKVETAVVITHAPSGVQGEASERRSQEQNRRQALFRLRVNLALLIRTEKCDEPPSRLWQQRCIGGRLVISSEHDDFPAILAEALDVLTARDFQPRAAAEHLGCSPSQLVRLLRIEPRALKWVNQQRRDRGLPPMK
jgi:hypothetical protein